MLVATIISVPVATHAISSELVPAQDPAYQEIHTLYNLGWLSENAGQLALQRLLTRYEMALITLNAVDKIVYSRQNVPPTVLQIVGNLVQQFESEIYLFGSDYAFQFKQYATREPASTGDASSELEIDLPLPPIGSISGDITPSPQQQTAIEGSEDFFDEWIIDEVVIEGDDGLTDSSTLENESQEQPSEQRKEQKSEEIISLTRSELEQIIEEKISEKIDNSGRTGRSLPYEIHGGTSISFVNRHVEGIPLDEEGEPIEDEDGEPIQSEHRLSQDLWLDLAAYPNENVTIRTRLTAENPTGFITDPTSIELQSINVIAETERMRLLLGTLGNVTFSDYTLSISEEDEDNRIDGFQIEYQGDKFSINALAGRRRMSPVDEEGKPTGVYPSYLAALQIATDALIKGLRMSANLVTQWDDSKWANVVADKDPTRLLTAGFALNGEVLGFNIAGEIATQVFDPNTTELGETSSNVATYIRVGKRFGETQVNVNARYIGENHRIVGADDLEESSDMWIPGEKGIGVSISRPIANEYGHLEFSLDTGTRYVRPEDEDETGEFESGILATLALNFDIPITYEEKSLGSLQLGNTTTYTRVQNVQNESIFVADVTNFSNVSATLMPIENWHHHASASFTYGIGKESDGTEISDIDRKELNFLYRTSYDWNPVERLFITPEYQFAYNKDFGLGEVHSYHHHLGANARYEVIPDQLYLRGTASIDMDRVFETELNDDGEPILGRSANTQLFKVGATYTPSWLKGLSLTADLGKRLVNYVLNDEDILDEDAWIVALGGSYTGSLGPNGNWRAGHTVEWNFDRSEVYRDVRTISNIGADYKFGELLTVSGNLQRLNNKESTTNRGLFAASLDLGANTSFGVRWSLEKYQDHNDESNNSVINEFTAFFSGQF